MVDTHNNPSSKPRDLSQRQRQVLEHLRLFRISTTAVIRRHFFAADATAEAIESFMARLRRRHYIRSATLIGQEDYYWITPTGLREVFSEDVSRSSVGSYAIVECFGRLTFCNDAPETRKKLSWRDFEERYPSLRHPRERQHQFYIDKQEGPPRLGLIHVDTGVRIERMVRKIQHHVLGKLLADPVWRTQVIDAERLTVAIVTTPASSLHSWHRPS